MPSCCAVPLTPLTCALHIPFLLSNLPHTHPVDLTHRPQHPHPHVQTHGWLLDGYPRSASQAEAIEREGIRPDVFLLIDVRFCCFFGVQECERKGASARRDAWLVEADENAPTVITTTPLQFLLLPHPPAAACCLPTPSPGSLAHTHTHNYQHIH